MTPVVFRLKALSAGPQDGKVRTKRTAQVVLQKEPPASIAAVRMHTFIHNNTITNNTSLIDLRLPANLTFTCVTQRKLFT